MQSNVNQYPFWNPENSGEAKNFALPQIPGTIQVEAIQKDAQRLRVPQEIEYNQNNLANWQYVPAYVPPPQAPVHVTDPYTQARSLLDYARSTLGTSNIGASDNRGNEGQWNKAGK